MPEAFLFLLLFETFVLLLFGEFSGVVSASFKKGFFGSSELVAGGLGALDFFIDDFLSLDLGVTAVLGIHCGPAVGVVWTGEGIVV